MAGQPADLRALMADARAFEPTGGSAGWVDAGGPTGRKSGAARRRAGQSRPNRSLNRTFVLEDLQKCSPEYCEAKIVIKGLQEPRKDLAIAHETRNSKCAMRTARTRSFISTRREPTQRDAKQQQDFLPTSHNKSTCCCARGVASFYRHLYFHMHGSQRD